MNARVRAIAGVTIMSVLLVLYFVFAWQRAFALLQTGTVLTISMGIALLILPLLGAWALARELVFGATATKLVDRLEAEDLLPEEEFSALASGRPVREEADAVFPKYREEAEADPDSWRAWMRLGIIYDACSDRTRARAAIRRAIVLERADRKHK